MKGNYRNFKFFNPEFWVGCSEDLWRQKFWIVFDRNTKNIKMYDVATMKLCQIVPFHYFDVNGIKWNQEQSSFIVFNKYQDQNCVITQV